MLQAMPEVEEPKTAWVKPSLVLFFVALALRCASLVFCNSLVGSDDCPNRIISGWAFISSPRKDVANLPGPAISNSFSFVSDLDSSCWRSGTFSGAGRVACIAADRQPGGFDP